ncbi:hypothetical protein [Streptomyces sp. NPDC007991]|uniref:hypothetical protein n=1 Tax=Streptomyces sp. NPDC007991 TaxID=3364803 RepID=UPI0036EAE552
MAGRWAAEKHPEATNPQAWTRDIAAKYIADTMTAVRGQWAIEWERITPRFDPRRTLALPLSVRAGRDPDPRIIDDAAWAKLMAAGLTLTAEDLRAYGTPRAKAAGWHAN